jgi:S-adenosylmethionine hydrolase
MNALRSELRVEDSRIAAGIFTKKPTHRLDRQWSDMSPRSAIITLLTDFGLQDEYVGVMKGVIASISSDTQVIDITHDIARHDIRQAALVLKSAFRFFPKGSIHVVVVDPGVGGHRKILCLKKGGHCFVAPDNGVLSLIVGNGEVEDLRHVTNDTFFLKPVSNTFHGRDIFAPVAGHLAEGVPMANLGTRLAMEEIRILDVSVPALSGKGEIVGEVISVDRFGNLVTNIDQKTFDRFTGEEDPAKVVIGLDDVTIKGVSASYDGVAEGTAVALWGSRGFLEISVNQADASACFDASVGQVVKLKFLGKDR